MSETKLQFLNRLMNDPGMRQRNRNAQDRRRACEAMWDEKQGDDPEPEPVAEPEPVPETEEPAPAEDDEAEDDAAQLDEALADDDPAA